MTRKVRIGNITIGGGEKVKIQSMTTAYGFEDTIEQILKLEEAGCEIVRIAVPDMNVAKNISKIKAAIKIPLVADIHFDYRLALEAIEQGVDKIRINPGNIKHTEEIVKLAKKKDIAIRIGVNSGSIEKEFLEKYKKPTSGGMVESAMKYIAMFEKLEFFNIVLSLKASNVKMTIEAYRHISKLTDYPLHVGVTEAGTISMGKIKSAVGIGALLADGIGDTIRVSLTANPIEEVRAAKQILKVFENDGIEIISCPTCSRCRIDIISIAEELERRLENCDKRLKIAVMGCAVNGPGEAREADIGIAGGNGEALIFRKGEIIKKIKQEDIIKEMMILVSQQ